MEKRQKPSLHNDWIDPDALFIVDRLQRAGFITYLVGGCVRDLLAEIHPKDYDIATSASPEQVRKLIRGAYIIGKRFPLVLVKRGQRQFEVATFRRNASPEELEASENSFIDNFYGTPEEDARRRDFTINGLFYDPIHDELIDYVEGLKDIDNGYIRMIGDPDFRLKEDPIRILRAIRLAHKLRFSIEESLREAIERNSPELVRSILPRKREEYFKLMRLRDPSLVFQELHDLKILPFILPTLSSLWDSPKEKVALYHSLSNTHDIVNDTSSTTLLMLPLLIALNELWKLADSDHDVTSDTTESHFQKLDTFFKTEWGLFRTELQTLYEALDLYYQMQPLEKLLRKGPRRLRSFFSREGTPLALHMAKYNCLFSGEQWLKIHAQLKNLRDSHSQSFKEDNTSVD